MGLAVAATLGLSSYASRAEEGCDYGYTTCVGTSCVDYGGLAESMGKACTDPPVVVHAYGDQIVAVEPYKIAPVGGQRARRKQRILCKDDLGVPTMTYNCGNTYVQQSTSTPCNILMGANAKLTAEPCM